MIVVDTSVWIDFLRETETRATRMLSEPRAMDDMVVGDVILLELLKGARGTRHAEGLENMLRQFRLVDMLGETIAVKAAHNFRTLRGLGVTIRKTTDLIIGTWCIANNAQLLHNDRDFDKIETYLGLAVA